MAEIASAYVSLMPSMKGFGSGIQRQAGSEVAGSGKFLGGLLGKGMLAGFAVVGVAAGVGKALYSIGSTFDDLSDTIRVTTGVTGKALDMLNESAQKVGKQVPVSFDQIGPVLSQVHNRLDLLGEPLEKITKQFLQLGHITGEEVDVETVTGALNAFSIKSGQTSKVMDQLFQVTQSTGIGFSDLASTLKSNGPSLAQFGLSIQQSAVLIGSLDKAGIDSNKTLASLRVAMANFAKAGRDPQKALVETITQIEAFAKAGDDVGAINLAAKMFGTRGAGQFVAAVKSGRLSVEQLTAAATGSGDTIAQAAKDTADFSEQWQIFKNRVLVTLEPVATRVFSAVGNAATVLNQQLGPALRSMSEQVRTGNGDFGKFVAYLQTFGDAIRDSLPVILDGLADSFKQIRAAIKDNKPELIQLGNAVKKLIPVMAFFASSTMGTFAAAVRTVTDTIGVSIRILNSMKSAVVSVGKAAAGAVAGFSTLAAGVRQKIANVVSTVKGIPGKVQVVFSNALTILSAAGKAIIQGLINGIKSMASAAAKAAVGVVTDALNAAKDKLGIKSPSKVWDREVGRMVVQGLIDGVHAKTKDAGDAAGQVVEKMTKKVKEKAANLRDALSSVKSEFASLVEPIAANFTGGLFDFDTAGAFTANLTTVKGTLNTLIGNFKELIGNGLSPGFLYRLFQEGGPALISSLAGLDKAGQVEAGVLFGQVTALGDQLGTAVAGATDKGAGLENQTVRLEKKLDKLIDHVDKGADRTGDRVNGAATRGHRRGK